MKHIFECVCNVQSHAINEFNASRKNIEEMFKSKIRVIRMIRTLSIYKVEYELIED